MLLPLENAVAIDATIRPEVDWSPPPPQAGMLIHPKPSSIPRSHAKVQYQRQTI